MNAIRKHDLHAEQARQDQARDALPRRSGYPFAESPVVRFRVKSVANDYLTCRTWDGTDEGADDYRVAKPTLLRHVKNNYQGLANLTTVDAQSVTADPTAAGDPDEDWVVTRAYVVDGEIFACIPQGGAGLTVDGQDVIWMDVNVDGRVWAIEC
jgi:hypothetical protein